MKDLIFLVPLILGFAIMALGFKLQIIKGMAMNRPVFGIALILGSLLWWFSGAILLVCEGKFYFTLNMLTVSAFFAGLAFFFPSPIKATRPNQHVIGGQIMVWLGLSLGFAHSFALMFIPAWSARLVHFYDAIGIHFY